MEDAPVYLSSGVVEVRAGGSRCWCQTAALTHRAIEVCRGDERAAP